MTDDTALVAGAREGILDAFNALVRAHERLAYNVALRMLGDADEAADVTQDSFIAAYEHLDDLRGPFRPWLLRIVVNRCYDALRRRKRGPRPLDEVVSQATPVAGDRDDPERQALSAELARAIERCLAELPPDQRAAVVLVDAQGLSYEETAEAMRVPLGTVRSRLFRGRARLRDALRTEGELLPPAYRHYAGTET
ncbi:MAG: sigma-70 family RNA polymerase sigma factor [Chloroflexi bacterium]|nr:sigma-70 family RNA polymerase sigma factor [Chloroflexota bacterium]